MGDPTPRWVRRVVIASVVPVSVLTAAPPGYADLGPDPRDYGTPDEGTQPIASAPLVVPPPQPTPAVPAATAISPVAEQIIAASAATQRLGEQTKALQDELTAAHQATEEARAEWAAANEALAASQSFGDQVGAPAEDEAADPSPTPVATASPLPSASPAPDPSATASADVSAPRADLAEVERLARTKLDEAIAAEKDVAGRHAVVLEQFQRHTAALQTLIQRNTDQLAAAQRARDEYEQSLAASRTAGAGVGGLQEYVRLLGLGARVLPVRRRQDAAGCEQPVRSRCAGAREPAPARRPSVLQHQSPRLATDPPRRYLHWTGQDGARADIRRRGEDFADLVDRVLRRHADGARGPDARHAVAIAVAEPVAI
jgi:hypothetical protein